MAMISAGVIEGASRWVQVVPLATSAQVGTAREGERGGDEVSCCVLPPRRLTGLRPLGGRREGGGEVLKPGLHWRAVAPRSLGGGRSGVGPGVPPAPYYPGPRQGGGGWGEGGELESWG